MAEQGVIKKDAGLSNDEDYAFLRQKGLDYIQNLGSDQWTDYNEHDPGITMLEALCYAITELGYRTDLPMQDLLTDANGQIPLSQTLYTAKNILTQSPLNIDDYRKLLVDIVGIHNAWLQYDDFYIINKQKIPAGEIAIYADCKKDELSYDVTPHPVYLSGLYKVLLDLENDDQFGDLNNDELQILNPASASFNAGDVSLTVIFQVWNDPAVQALLVADPTSISAASATFTTGADIAMQITFTYMAGIVSNTTTLNGIVNVDLQPAGKTVGEAEIQGFFTADFITQVVNLYLLKIQMAKKIVEIAILTLNENRNLCEDFVSVTTITDEEIAICCDIDVLPSADMEKVQADVFFAIEEYMDPSINFYLLSEMQAKGYTTDQIFEGPVLQHGFIDTPELEKTELRLEIYASDIISLIMNVDGVLAARNFMMTKYGPDGKPVTGESGKSWCMPITPGCKPVFSETKSKVLFYKNQFPYLPTLSEVRDTLKWLRAIKARNKLSGHVDDLPIPPGKYFPLDSYTSIEYLFPNTYDIGAAGLPPNADNARRGQAKQLQAYLLLYDQLLADFFSQLKNARELFSTDITVQTYYAQFLGNIKDIMPIYKTISAKTIDQLVMQNQDSTVPINEWQRLYETNEVFLDRRNRFLDHLLSRFGESFNEYVLLMNSLDPTTQQLTNIVPASLITNKIKFLQSYPVVSYQRGRAFDYFPQKPDFSIDTSKLWDTDNVSGVEKKLCLLGGMDNMGGVATYFRRFLYCLGNVVIVPTSDTPPKYLFSYTNSNASTLTSVTAYDNTDDLNNALPSFMDLVLAGENFIVKPNGGNFVIGVQDANGNDVAVSNDFVSTDAADAALALFITEFNSECSSEGMHLIEHILLRPRNGNFYRAPVCLDPDCDFCGEQDPYSFRISIVLPYWPVQFRNMAFRTYFEDIIRQELPAHTIVKVCWINNQSLFEFENDYEAWIIAMSKYSLDNTTFNIDALQAANDKLLKLLFNLHSEYPVATLHDCAESKDTNPVMLGKTILGSLKN